MPQNPVDAPGTYRAPTPTRTTTQKVWRPAAHGDVQQGVSNLLGIGEKRRNLGIRSDVGSGATLQSKTCRSVLSNQPIVRFSGSVPDTPENRILRMKLAIKDSIVTNDVSCFNALSFTAQDIKNVFTFNLLLPHHSTFAPGQILDSRDTKTDEMFKNLDYWVTNGLIQNDKLTPLRNGLLGAFREERSGDIERSKNRITEFIQLGNILQKLEGCADGQRRDRKGMCVLQGGRRSRKRSRKRGGRRIKKAGRKRTKRRR